MKDMKTMKRIRRTAGKICFVAPWLNKTNIFWAGNGKNASYPFISFMFFEVVRTFLFVIAKNMKIMKMYEARLFKGFYLPCYLGRGLPTQKHEANMKKYEEVGMKTILIWLISAVVLTGCSSAAVQAASPGTPDAVRSRTPAATATVTLTPAPTVDWQGTAVVAQSTADEARRLDTAATSQEKERIQEQLSWTAQSDQWTAQSISWTATMALTSIPLTSTQQVVVNTQVPIQQALQAGQLTATKEAPTQIVAIVDAENYREYGKLDFIIRIIALGALSVFLFGMGVFMLRSRNNEKPSNIVTASKSNDDLTLLNQTPETVVMVKTDNGQGYGENLLYTVPCSPAQLSELAERVIKKNETLGVNNWEGEKTLLTRAVIGRLRAFFQGNKMAVSAGAGRVVLTDNGLAFLRGWLDRNSLPYSYSFTPEKNNMPLNMSHDHDAHAVAHGGGE